MTTDWTIGFSVKSPANRTATHCELSIPKPFLEDGDFPHGSLRISDKFRAQTLAENRVFYQDEMAHALNSLVAVQFWG